MDNQNNINSSDKPDNPAKAHLSRNHLGLIERYEYAVGADGFIDWRAMIPKDGLVPNREKFPNKTIAEINALDVSSLDDSQVLILLGALKKLAKIRGYNYVKFNALRIDRDYVSMSCEIEFIGNYETDFRPVVFQSIANASADNVNGDFQKYLETIAENRAFARCIRNFLGINICSKEEVVASDIVEDRSIQIPISSGGNIVQITNSSSPISILKNRISQLNWSFKDFVTKVREINDLNLEYNKKLELSNITHGKKTIISNVDSWKTFEDIPNNLIFPLIKKVEEYSEKLLASKSK